ncbi:hypothetical protein L2E82_47993 [Cichorium intybus]|uniref:Uncharacterized protein n=1 Tax=Cichorium intybus TaxID=13427 RepID=A0ACB8YXA5_CICIN|nr:hypothetical protein L2E82_47993 [Cichorium intybus]
MGSLKDPKTWIPHINPNDCSKKICNIYCTKWCTYVILPSPPPPLPHDDSGGATLSPAVIVIIVLMGSFFLLMGYYVVISRYCLRNIEPSTPLNTTIENQETHNPETGVTIHGEDHDPLNYVPWLVLGKGLDEAMIKSITICKYKRGDGLVLCSDCSVCLGEFQEDESIKLLPKCSHAFHVHCIDTWLKTHSNCPLCRANVCCDVKSSSPISPPPPPPPPPPRPPPPVMTSDLDVRDVFIEIREEGQRKIRRSKSMTYLCQNQSSIAEVMFFDEAEEMAREKFRLQRDAGSSGMF